MLYLQKGNFQKIVRWIAGSWMTANQATLFGIIFIALTALGYYVGLSYDSYRWILLFVPFFLLMRMAMNALDGMLAREYKTATVGGEILNEALDIIGDTVCYGILYFIPNSPVRSLTLFLILTWAAEFFGVLGKGMPGGVRRHETLGGGKPDRAVWMGLFAIAVFFKPQFIYYLPSYLLSVSILIALTCFIRVKKILETTKGKKYESYTWIGR